MQLHNQKAYCGQTIAFSCDSLSPVCRTYTIAPENRAFTFGFFTAIDFLIIVFALGTKLPSITLQHNHQQHNQEQPSTATASIPSSSSSRSFFFESFNFASSLEKFDNLLLFLLLSILVIRVVFRIISRVPAERLTVIRNVGLQLHCQDLFGNWQPTELLDVGTITSLFIHEGFLRHRCIFFLAVVVQDRPKLILPFFSTLPRLPVLQTVLRGARAVLYNEPEQGLSLADISEQAKKEKVLN